MNKHGFCIQKNSVAKISVVIPAYRRAHLLGEALNSVLAQTCQDFEVVIVDDYSEDGGATRKTVESYCDSRFKYICLESNRGPAGARNAALPYCQGEYISFLDSDDLFRPRKLEIHAGILQDNPDVAMVYSDEFHLNYDGSLSERPVRADRVLPSGFIARDFFMESFIATMTVTLRRTVIAEMGGFDETLIWNEDDDLWFRIMLKYRVICAEYVSGIRRLHATNMSRDRDKMVWYQLQCITKYISSYVDFINANRELVSNRLTAIIRPYVLGSIRNLRIPTLQICKLYLKAIRQLHETK
jgi:glycosyltransferase involved in cell wall biosynthesis